MKRIVLIIVIAAAFASLSAQPTWTSIASGDWSNPAIWSTSGGASGAPVPTLSSNMRVIVAGHAVTQYSNHIQILQDARLEITGGGRLRIATNFMLYQNGGNTVFKIDNGSLEASGNSTAAMLIRLEYGLIEWTDAIVRSGGLMYVANTRATLNNACISSASWMQWSGVGTNSNFSTMNNVGLFAGTHSQNPVQLVISNSYINLNAAKFFTGSPGNLNLVSSNLTGSIFSIYLANGQINTNGLVGTPELNYWCASTTPNLSLFSGSRIQSCQIAYEQPCGPQQPPCDVSVTKLASHQSPGAGQQMSFNIKVANHSSFTARSIRVYDLVPSGYELLNVSPQVGNWSNPYWNIGDLSSFQEVQAIVYVRIKSAGSYTNTASLSPTGNYYTDLVTANNQSTVTPNVQSTADLQITKVVDNQYPQVNQLVNYTIQVKNNGPGVPANINVTDFLPSGLHYYSHSVTHGVSSPSGWNITGWQLNPGQTATLNLVARVLPTGNYVNSATVTSELTDPNTANNTASVEIFPQIADLELSITADNLQPIVGSNVTLTVSLKNNGPTDASQVQVNWAIPGGLLYVSATPEQGTANSAIWAVGTLGQGATTSANIIVKTMPSGSYIFQSTASALTFDPIPANNQSSITIQPTQSCDLKIFKSVISPPNPTYIYGSTVQFNIIVWNLSMSNATGVVVTDELPAGYTLISVQPTTGTWAAPHWNIGNMPGGSMANIQIYATINPTGDYTNTASIAGDQPDPDPTNNSASVSISPQLTSDMAIQIEVSNTNPIVGSEITYTVHATNNGPNPSIATRVLLSYQPGLQFVSSNPGVGTFASNAWEIGTMNPGEHHALTLVYKVTSGGTLHLSGSTYNTNGDHNGANNYSSIQINAINAIDLAVTKTVNNANPDIGTNVVFTIRLYNYGNIAATNVVVEDQLPSGYQFVSANTSYGTWSAPHWNIPNMPGGFMAAMTITVKVLATGEYNNTASAHAAETDPFPLNNSATAEVHVVPLNGPTANDDIATGIKNQPLDINVLANDIAGDVPINPNSVQIVAGSSPDPTAQGVISIDPVTGMITFVPVSGFTGTIISQYSIRDMNNLPAQAQLTLNIIEPLTNIFPATGPGTLAFEDLWPGKGDYDFNDLVIDYQFEIQSDMTNHVVSVTGTFTIQAFGAALENGFGFQLPTSVNQTNLSVSGSRLTEGFIQLNANGLEEGQDKPTIIVFDNTFAQMQHPGIGTGVNTDPDAPYVDPVTILIEILFVPGTTSINDLNIAAFNPFIIVNKVRGHEIHLPNYPPTSKADISLFGKWEDASRPLQGKYYVTANNLPWAINLYEKFDWPKEKRDITHAYHKFIPWAVSGGVQFPDWYKNLTGYRNSSLIYQVPSK